MKTQSRREFLGGAAAAAASVSRAFGADTPAASDYGLDFPIVDYHVHLNAMTLDQVAATSKERGVKYGVVEHLGTELNDYPIVLSSDAELAEWIAKLDQYPVYKGAQAEWIEWVPSFSKDVLAQLDYILTDAWTVRDANGNRIKAFGRDYDPGDDPEAFMKMYVDWHVEIIETLPLDILSHPMWVPRKFTSLSKQLWTEERMRTVIDALKKTGTALEIDAGVRLPTLECLQIAKEEGVKFSFGTNSGGRAIGNLDFAFEMAKALGLTKDDMFYPQPNGRKPIQRRNL